MLIAAAFNQPFLLDEREAHKHFRSASLASTFIRNGNDCVQIP